MFVSIIIPTYKDLEALMLILRALEFQTYKNFEFIIIDDCSQDQTFNILQEYQRRDSRIRILHNEKNLGLAASLNKGIIESSGDWIVRMDDDDISLHDRVDDTPYRRPGQFSDVEIEFINSVQRRPEIEWAIDNSFDGIYVQKYEDFSRFVTSFKFAVYMKEEQATFWKLKFNGQ